MNITPDQKSSLLRSCMILAPSYSL
jgi:hypothetical protein